MKIFQCDVQVAATAYIVAESEEEANRIFKEQFTNYAGDELCTGGIVDGSSFESMIEQGEDDGAFATISPAITFHGTFGGGEPEFEVTEAEAA